MSRDQLMVSSGDEFGSYEQSPRVPTSGTSKANAVAGPSKPASKRKKAMTSETLQVEKRTNVVDTIAISSDEEDGHKTMRGRAVGATTIDSTSNGRVVGSRGKGKAMATAKRKKTNESDEAGLTENVATDSDVGGTSSRREKVGGSARNNSGKSNELLRKQNERLSKQLKDITSQRDTMSTQLEELFQLRHTEPEAQLAEQKAQYEALLKAKEDTVQELQNALSRIDKLSQSGATTSLHFLTRETADEEKQDVQREIDKLKDSLKKKDGIIHAKDVEINELNENVKILGAELKAEIDIHTRSASRNQPSSATKHSGRAGDPKNSLAIRLYEELTNLLVTNVRHEPGMFKEDDAIYTCVQTTSSGKSLNFSLRFFKEAEGDNSSNVDRSGRTVDKVVYTPLLLEQETREFVEQLEFLASPFTFQKEQMSVFTKTLLTYLEGEAEDSQSNTEQMEVGDDD